MATRINDCLTRENAQDVPSRLTRALGPSDLAMLSASSQRTRSKCKPYFSGINRA